MELIEVYGLTMKEIAKRIGCSDRSVRRWWRGKSMSFYNREALLKLFEEVRAERASANGAAST